MATTSGIIIRYTAVLWDGPIVIGFVFRCSLWCGLHYIRRMAGALFDESHHLLHVTSTVQYFYRYLLYRYPVLSKYA